MLLGAPIVTGVQGSVFSNGPPKLETDLRDRMR